jgi:hypothetical protein
MKIVAATGARTVLVEMTKNELERLTKFQSDGKDSYYDIDLQRLAVGKELDICKTMDHAEKILADLRGVGPELKRASERLARLSEETMRFNHQEESA